MTVKKRSANNNHLFHERLNEKVDKDYVTRVCAVTNVLAHPDVDCELCCEIPRDHYLKN